MWPQKKKGHNDSYDILSLQNWGVFLSCTVSILLYPHNQE